MAEETKRLHKRILLLRRVLPLAIFALVILYETLEHTVLLPLPYHKPEPLNPTFFLAGILLYGAAGPLVIWLALTWIAARVSEQQRAREELERVHARLQESTSHLATLHEISRTIASTVELPEVMDQVARAIAQGTGSTQVCVGLFDEEQGSWTHFSSNCEGDRYGEDFPHILDDTLHKWRNGNYDPILRELQLDHLSTEVPASRLLVTPVARGKTLLGVISTRFPTSQPPAESHVKVLRTIADELAAAIEATRLRTRHLQALYEVGQTMRAEFNLDRLLGQILDKVIQVCSAQTGSVVLIEEGTNELVVKATRNVPPEGLIEKLDNDGSGTPWVVGHVVATRVPLVVPDVQAEPKWNSHVACNGIHSVIGVPMTVGEQVIGAISLGKPQRRGFSEAHLNLLTAIASQAALVVRNAQLYNRAEELAIAEERNRIAREIHDGIAQNLAYLISKADLCLILMNKLATPGPEANRVKNELSAIKEGLRDNIRGVRRSIFALRPLELERLGFVPALSRFAEEFGEQNGICVQLNIVGDASSLPSSFEPPLFRAVQEALSNVGKHANARNVWVDLDLSRQEQINLTVRDDGRGFDTSLLPDAPLRGHLGIAQMKEKVVSLGGTFVVDAAPGRSTKLEIRLPVRQQVCV